MNVQAAMLRRTCPVWKQTSHPPRQTLPLERNPLTRWSRFLPAWSALPRHKPHLGQLTVGLEGCHSAFNATNAIRTCLFFGTREPPAFLTLRRWQDIAFAQARPVTTSHEEVTPERASDPDAENGAKAEDEQWDGVARFGARPFHAEHNTEHPIVALENFTSRSQSIFSRRFPFACRLVVGHENHGVSPEYIDGPSRASDGVSDGAATRAEAVLYIPQYGTISSINLVTSMGIALFYAFLDEYYPSSRVLSPDPSTGPHAADSTSRSRAALEQTLQRYQRCFRAPIPTTAPADMRISEKAMRDPQGNRSPRMDPRPLHPAYFKKSVKDIQAAHEAFRDSLLAFSNEQTSSIRAAEGKPPVAARSRFGLSVVYENDYDQRNFGGLVRNANAFLVDRVCYVGKRRYNVVGAVGSNHYTPPVYLGKSFEDCLADASPTNDGDDDGANSSEGAHGGVGTEEEEETPAEEYERMIRSVMEEQGTASRDGVKLSDHQERIVKLSLWSLHMRGNVERACGGPARFWFLDCGHRNLYAEDFGLLRQMQKEGLPVPTESARHRSSLESLVWYMTHCTEEDFTLSLCDREERLFNAAGDGVVLVVPQEGKLPHIGLLMQCEKIVTVVPDDVGKAGEDSDVQTMRGLPSQVATGIALQRLSAVLHPGLRNL